MKSLTLLTFCLCLAAAMRAEASDDPLDNWPSWRGPLSTGAAPRGDPPIKWNEKMNIQWKVAIPGKGSSTPAVWGDRVFVLTAVNTGKEAPAAELPKVDPKFVRKTKAPTTYYEFLVLCLHRKTGQVLWKKIATTQVPHEGIQPTHSYAASSPVTDGKYVYASFGSRGIYCYDVEGKLRWQRDLGRLTTRYSWGEAVTPALHGELLIVDWDQEEGSFLAALDTKTGETVWKVPRDEVTTWTTPLVVTYKNRTQIVVNGTKRARGYDLKGKLLWECGGQTINAIPSAVADPALGLVFCMSGYTGSAAFAIPLDSSGDLTKTKKTAWHLQRGTPYVPSPLLVGGRLYFTQGNSPLLTCVEAKTGKVIFERERLNGLSSFYSSPVAAAGRIYLVDQAGTTMVLKQSDKLEVLATNPLEDAIDASPAVVGTQLFLRGHKYLYCIAAK
jgi:outer membrane protein assembly factor BamB